MSWLDEIISGPGAFDPGCDRLCRSFTCVVDSCRKTESGLGSRHESRPERTPRFLRRKGSGPVVEGEPARASEEALAHSVEDDVNYGPG